MPKLRTPQGQQGRPDQRYVKIPDIKPRQEKPREDRADPCCKKQPHSPGQVEPIVRLGPRP